MNHCWKSVLNARQSALANLPEDTQRSLKNATDRCIYVYSHVRSKQVVYSLERVMNNNNAMKQLPILLKQMKPASLRKDLWRPLAAVKFPSSHQRLEAYRQLREYRKRHELEWPQELKKDEEGKVVSRRLLARRIADQKANSVADLAAVLLTHEKVAEQQRERRGKIEARRDDPAAGVIELEHEIEAMGWNGKRKNRKYRLLELEKQYLERQIHQQEDVMKKDLQKQVTDVRSKRRKARRPPDFSMENIQIDWADVNDRHYASSWPESVVHSSKVQDLKQNYLPWLTDFNERITAIENEPSYQEYLEIKDAHSATAKEYSQIQDELRQNQKDEMETTKNTEELMERREELQNMRRKIEALTPSDEVIAERRALINQRKTLLATMRVLRQARHTAPAVFTDPLLQPEAIAPSSDEVAEDFDKPPSRLERMSGIVKRLVGPSSRSELPSPPSQETGYRGFIARLTHRAAYGRTSASVSNVT